MGYVDAYIGRVNSAFTMPQDSRDAVHPVQNTSANKIKSLYNVNKAHCHKALLPPFLRQKIFGNGSLIDVKTESRSGKACIANNNLSLPMNKSEPPVCKSKSGIDKSELAIEKSEPAIQKSASAIIKSELPFLMLESSIL